MRRKTARADAESGRRQHHPSTAQRESGWVVDGRRRAARRAIYRAMPYRVAARSGRRYQGQATPSGGSGCRSRWGCHLVPLVESECSRSRHWRRQSRTTSPPCPALFLPGQQPTYKRPSKKASANGEHKDALACKAPFTPHACAELCVRGQERIDRMTRNCTSSRHRWLRLCMALRWPRPQSSSPSVLPPPTLRDVCSGLS